jgi:hypothetical protein
MLFWTIYDYVILTNKNSNYVILTNDYADYVILATKNTLIMLFLLSTRTEVNLRLRQ